MIRYIRLFFKTLYIQLLVTLIVILGCVMWFQKNDKNIYESTATILVNEDINSPYFEKEDENNEKHSVITSQEFVDNLVKLSVHYLNSYQYQQLTIQRLVDSMPEIQEYDFDKNVEVGTYAGTSLITVKARYTENSEYAALIANTLCQIYKEMSAKQFGNDYFVIYEEAAVKYTPVNWGFGKTATVLTIVCIIGCFFIIVVIDILARSAGIEINWGIKKIKKDKKKTKDEMDLLEDPSFNEFLVKKDKLHTNSNS